MYRQSKPFNLSSLIVSLSITALVIGLASSAKAQEPGVLNTPIPRRANVDVPREVTPSADRASVLQEKQIQINERQEVSNTAMIDWAERRNALASSTAERRTILAEKRAIIASSTIERRAALGENVQERIRNTAGNLVKVLNNTISKMSQFSNRLREKAVQLSDRGVDTTEVLSTLSEVDRLITAAEAAIVDINVNIEYTVTSANPKEDWQDAKTQFQEVRSALKDIHDLLRTVVSELKTAVKETN